MDDIQRCLLISCLWCCRRWLSGLPVARLAHGIDWWMGRESAQNLTNSYFWRANIADLIGMLFHIAGVQLKYSWKDPNHLRTISMRNFTWIRSPFPAPIPSCHPPTSNKSATEVWAPMAKPTMKSLAGCIFREKAARNPLSRGFWSVVSPPMP